MIILSYQLFLEMFHAVRDKEEKASGGSSQRSGASAVADRYLDDRKQISDPLRVLDAAYC